MKGVVRAVLVAAMVFVLSGCYLVEMEMTVSSDDKVSGTMTVALQEEATAMLEELGSDDGALIDVGDLPDGVTTEPYDQDGYTGQTVTFTDVPLEEFNSVMQQDDGTFSLTRSGDQYLFTGTIDMSGGSESAGDTDSPGSTDGPDLEGFEEAITQALASGSMTLTMTFPGEILDTNGEVDGTTVTWDLADFLEQSELHATAVAGDAAAPEGEQGESAADTSADDEGDSGFPVLPVVLGAVAIVVVGGAAYLITRRRKA